MSYTNVWITSQMFRVFTDLNLNLNLIYYLLKVMLTH